MRKPELKLLATFVLGRIQILNFLLQGWISMSVTWTRGTSAYLLRIMVPNLFTLLVSPDVVGFREGIQEYIKYGDANQNTIATAICYLIR
jgi:hypothetical protein